MNKQSFHGCFITGRLWTRTSWRFNAECTWKPSIRPGACCPKGCFPYNQQPGNLLHRIPDKAHKETQVTAIRGCVQIICYNSSAEDPRQRRSLERREDNYLDYCCLSSEGNSWCCAEVPLPRQVETAGMSALNRCSSVPYARGVNLINVWRGTSIHGLCSWGVLRK